MDNEKLKSDGRCHGLEEIPPGKKRQKRGSWTYERHGTLVLFSLCGFKRNMQRGCSDQTKLLPTNTKIASALDGAHKNPILAGYEMPSLHGVEQLQ
jgi:hypothetical protein